MRSSQNTARDVGGRVVVGSAVLMYAKFEAALLPKERTYAIGQKLWNGDIFMRGGHTPLLDICAQLYGIP